MEAALYPMLEISVWLPFVLWRDWTAHVGFLFCDRWSKFSQYKFEISWRHSQEQLRLHWVFLFLFPLFTFYHYCSYLTVTGVSCCQSLKIKKEIFYLGSSALNRHQADPLVRSFSWSIFFVFYSAFDAELILQQLSSYPCGFRLLPLLPTSFEKHM